MNGELVSALDGDWGASEQRIETKVKEKAQAQGVDISSEAVHQATRDSVRALMLIRAYRVRGHLHAKLDPLGIAKPADDDYNELSPKAYGFTEADYDRKIFIDNVLGMEFATIRQMVDILERTYCSTLRHRVHAHLQPGREGLAAGAHRGPGQGRRLHQRRQARDPQQADRGGRLREVPRRQVQGHQALRPRRRRGADPGARADHQARRLHGPEGDRLRHGPSRPPQRALPGHGQAAPGDLPRVQGRLVQARGRRGLGRREVPSRRLVRPRVRPEQGAPVADRQPLASRDRRSRGDGQGARQAGRDRRPLAQRDRAPGDAGADPAAAHPRRCGLRRPGRRRRVLRPVGPARPPRRRHAALHHQQPDRLHHQSALLALLALSRPTSPRSSRRRSSTSTATIRRRWSMPPRWRPNSG